MRILVLSPWGLHGGCSGPLALLDRLMGAVAEQGATVDVAYRRRPVDTPPAWLAHGHPLLPAVGAAAGRAGQAAWTAAATAFLARHGRSYDVVHVHGGRLPATVPLLALGPRPKATRVVLPVLEGGDLGLPAHGPTRLLKQQAVRIAGLCDVGLALSEGIAAELRSAGMPTDRVRRIYNPGPRDLARPATPRTLASARRARATAGAAAGGSGAGSPRLQAGAAHDRRHLDPGSHVRLGFLGRLTETKRPHAVIEAVARLDADGVRAEAILIGPDGHDRRYADRLRRLPHELGIADRVHLTGMRTDAVDLLAERADLLVLPSSAEGLPAALVEALACAIPAIVTDVGAMGAVAAESGAALVTDGSPDDIAAWVHKALGCYPALSANALAYAGKRLSPDSVADTYLSAVTKDVARVP